MGLTYTDQCFIHWLCARYKLFLWLWLWLWNST